jgi:hypothetical protein
LRELYACQLDLTVEDGTVDVPVKVLEWVARPSGLDLVPLETEASTVGDPAGHLVTVETVDLDGGGAGWTCTWSFPDEASAALRWLTRIAVARHDATVIVTVRIGVEQDARVFQIQPTRFTFLAPAIVRTLLREYGCVDAGVRVEPAFRALAAADVDRLADFLLSPERRLPVLVVTRPQDTARAIDAGELARQLAGLAHVEVLTTHLASIALSERIGRGLSVWGGSVRLYWPGFTLDDDGRRHRYWTRTRLDEIDLVDTARSWLGAVSTASVPENPAVTAARSRIRGQVAENDLPGWVEELLDQTDSELADARAENRRLEAALSVKEQELEDALDELGRVRQQFATYSAAGRGPEASEEVDLDALSVLEAFELAVQRSGEHVLYLDSARDGVLDFQSYESPRRLYEALVAVDSAAEAWQNGGLGPGFGAFFHEYGYEYAQKNPAARARPTRAHYRRNYGGGTVSMEPHLKVDRSTSPDQCLRVYWFQDDTAKVLVVGHVGRHLPD